MGARILPCHGARQGVLQERFFASGTGAGSLSAQPHNPGSRPPSEDRPSRWGVTIDAAAARGVPPAPPRHIEMVSDVPPPASTLAGTLPYPLVVAVAAVAVGSALALRLTGLGAMGLGPTEAAVAGRAAALLGLPDFVPYFSTFRGPPQLFQLSLAGVFAVTGPGDLVAQVVATVFGLATIAVTYFAARECYGPRSALVAALVLAFMPYHVLVSRQALVDGPTALWVTLALFCLARFARTERAPWALATMAFLGAGVLSKESAFLFVPVAYAFLASRRWPNLNRSMLLLSAVVLAALIAAYPMSYSQNGEGLGAHVARALVERGEQPWHFYATAVAPAFGIPVLLGLLAWVALLWKRRSWREVLLSLWVAVPLLAFVTWPVREFAFLVPLAPAVAIMTARALEELPSVFTARPAQGAAAAVAATACVVLAATSYLALPAPSAPTAMSSSILGARETGAWIDQHLPPGATLLAADPALARVLEFYGHRRALALTEVPDVPSLDPTIPEAEHPGKLIARSELQYIVWDTQSAARSPSKSDRLLGQVARHRGREVYRFESQGATAAGNVTFPATIVYEVRP